MVKMNATQEKAEQHYTRLEEWIYDICIVQPINIDTRERLNP